MVEREFQESYSNVLKCTRITSICNPLNAKNWPQHQCKWKLEIFCELLPGTLCACVRNATRTRIAVAFLWFTDSVFGLIYGTLPIEQLLTRNMYQQLLKGCISMCGIACSSKMDLRSNINCKSSFILGRFFFFFFLNDVDRNDRKIWHAPILKMERPYRQHRNCDDRGNANKILFQWNMFNTHSSVIFLLTNCWLTSQTAMWFLQPLEDIPVCGEKK